MKVVRKLLPVFCALLFMALTRGVIVTLPVVTFNGLCDLTTCAEGYSVSRSTKASYSGPLFQLYNGSSTLDIGQNGSHGVDLSTWSAFCSGVASNCKYAKIYAQIHTGGANDLIPSVFFGPFGPDCTGGGAFKCATPFSIDATTGLPIFISNGTAQTSSPYNIGAQTGLYTLVNDQNATGVNGPASSSSITYIGRSMVPPASSPGGMCCGPFGIGHAYNSPDTLGTDFFISIAFGHGNFSQWNQCISATNYCIGIDEESEGDWADYGSSIINLIATITYDQPSNKVTADLNGTQLINKTPTATFSNTGNTIHLGAGGDLSEPAPATFWEIIVTNSAMSLATHTTISNNVKAYYPTTTFGPP